jgi:hypothetical protein
MVCRASSTCASQYWTAPTSASGLQRRRLAQRLARDRWPVPRDAAARAAEQAHRVVERDAGADVRALPAAVLQRVEERHRADQVRGEALQQQRALAQGLGDQPEVEHLEVAQPAVHELAAAAARAAGPVAGLDQPVRSPRVTASSAQPAPTTPPR